MPSWPSSATVRYRRYSPDGHHQRIRAGLCAAAEQPAALEEAFAEDTHRAFQGEALARQAVVSLVPAASAGYRDAGSLALHSQTLPVAWLPATAAIKTRQLPESSRS
jgi:hypothetical protein